jgi:hypothetical protein
MFGLDDIGTAISIASSAKSLLGGGGGEGSSMKKQLGWQLRSAREMPSAQVAGLRAAGLNPMLAVGGGISAPPPITSSPGKDAEISTARSLAAASTANQAAQARLYSAQAEKTQAETATELKRPENVEAQTGVSRASVPKIEQDTRTSYAQMQQTGSLDRLQTQLAHTQEWVTKKSIADYFFRELELDLARSNLGPRQSAEIKKIAAEARSAETEADLNESLREFERFAGIAGIAVGSARALLHSIKK